MGSAVWVPFSPEGLWIIEFVSRFGCLTHKPELGLQPAQPLLFSMSNFLFIIKCHLFISKILCFSHPPRGAWERLPGFLGGIAKVYSPLFFPGHAPLKALWDREMVFPIGLQRVLT